MDHGRMGWVGGNRAEGRQMGGMQDLFQGRTEDEGKKETAGSKAGYVIWRGTRGSFTKFRAGSNFTANRKLTEVCQLLV